MRSIQRLIMQWWSRFGNIKDEVLFRDGEISELETRAQDALADLERQQRNTQIDAEARTMIQERRMKERLQRRRLSG